MNRTLQHTLLLVLGLALSSCAAPTLPPEETVVLRSQERWDALLRGDAETAYGYTTPGYRELNSVNQYRARFAAGIGWVAARAESATCEEDRCEVKVGLTYRLPKSTAEHTRVFDEVWIRLDDTWWIYHKP
jgi:hypothetical protein